VIADEIGVMWGLSNGLVSVLYKKFEAIHDTTERQALGMIASYYGHESLLLLDGMVLIIHTELILLHLSPLLGICLENTGSKSLSQPVYSFLGSAACVSGLVRCNIHILVSP
jgi:hypothetical protein